MSDLGGKESLGGDDGSLGLDDPPQRAKRRCSERAGRQHVHLTIPRDTHYLALVRRVVADLSDLAGFRRPEIDKIELAVDEACSNAIVYQVDDEGAGKFDEIEIEVAIDRPRRGQDARASRDVGGIEIILRDRGDPYPFETKGNFDLEDHLRRMEPGGLGIYIIKNFMDEVAYEHSRDDGNVLTMTKFLPS